MKKGDNVRHGERAEGIEREEQKREISSSELPVTLWLMDYQGQE